MSWWKKALGLIPGGVGKAAELGVKRYYEKLNNPFTPLVSQLTKLHTKQENYKKDNVKDAGFSMADFHLKYEFLLDKSKNNYDKAIKQRYGEKAQNNADLYKKLLLIDEASKDILKTTKKSEYQKEKETEEKEEIEANKSAGQKIEDAIQRERDELEYKKYKEALAKGKTYKGESYNLTLSEKKEILGIQNNNVFDSIFNRLSDLIKLLDKKELDKRKYDYFQKRMRKMQDEELGLSDNSSETNDLNNSALAAASFVNYVHSELKKNPKLLDNETVSKNVQDILDVYYSSLVTLGKQEADKMGYGLLNDEVVAHNRNKSVSREIEETGLIGLQIGLGYLFKAELWGSMDDKEKEYEKQQDFSLFDALEKQREDLNLQAVNDKLDSMNELQRENMVNDFLKTCSGANVFSKNNIRRFDFGDKQGDARATDLMGIRGFNQWTRYGYFDELLKDKNQLEVLAANYNVILDKEGEASAKLWAQSKLQSLASDNTPLFDFHDIGAVLTAGAADEARTRWGKMLTGFQQDIIGDAILTVGSAAGFVAGVKTLITDQDLEEAIDVAYDNILTRYGSDLMHTGMYNYEKLNEYREAFDSQGLSTTDMITDPFGEGFLDRYGGSGVGAWGMEQIRLQSHTLFAVYAGKLYGKIGGGAGELASRFIKAENKVLKIKAASNYLGSAWAASNEGVEDGLNVKDDVYDFGVQALNQKYQRMAISEMMQQAGIVGGNPKANLLQLMQELKIDPVGDDFASNRVFTEDGQLKTNMSTAAMILIISSVPEVQEAIQQYMDRDDVKEQYNEELKQAQTSAIYAGALTAVTENIINGGLRFNQHSSRANIVARNRQMKKLFDSIKYDKTTGKVIVDKVTARQVRKDVIHDAWGELKEEVGQSVTSDTATGTANNHILNSINGMYNSGSWNDFFSQIHSDYLAACQAAGESIQSAETWEAGVSGFLGSALGYVDAYKNKKGKYRLGLNGSIFSTRREVAQRNKEVEDLQTYLQDAVDKAGGINVLKNMFEINSRLKKYNDAINDNKKYLANEEAIHSLIANASTIHMMKHTEFGKIALTTLDKQAKRLGITFGEETTEELKKQAARRVLESGNKDALIDARMWLAKENPNAQNTNEETQLEITDDEVDALVKVTETALQLQNFYNEVAEHKERAANLPYDVSPEVLNAYAVQTALINSQDKRLQQQSRKIDTFIASLRGSDAARSPIDSNKKLHIARFGNGNKSQAVELDKTSKQLQKDKKTLKVRKAEFKALEREFDNWAESGRAIEAIQLGEDIMRDISSLTESIRLGELRITDYNKHRPEVVEQEMELTVSDILSLPAVERDEMLRNANDTKYSASQKLTIKRAKELLQTSGMKETIDSLLYLEDLLRKNRNEIFDLITNPAKYEKMVHKAKANFRNTILESKYGKDMYKDFTKEEVYEFVNKLDQDVEEGLITEIEKNKIINLAKKYEQKRRNSVEDKSTVGDGWAEYDKVGKLRNSYLNSLKHIKDIKALIDNKQADILFNFLEEKHMTLESFNKLSAGEKMNLLTSSNTFSELMKPLGNPLNYSDYNLAASYTHIAANIQNEYVKLLARREKGIIAPPVGEIDTSTPVNDEDSSSAKQIEERRKVLKNREATDGNGRVGSKITQFLRFTERTLNSEDTLFNKVAAKLREKLLQIGMDSNPIDSVEMLTQQIDDVVRQESDPELNSYWAIVRNNTQKLTKAIERENKKYANESLRTALTRPDNAQAHVMRTSSISEIKNNPKKKSIRAFLEKFNYRLVASLMSLSNRSRGGTQHVYYVVDPNVRYEYSQQFDEKTPYEDTKHLPVFTCVEVDDGYENSIPVKVNGVSIKVAPIGVLVEGGQVASGSDWLNLIRLLGVSQLNDNAEAFAITNDSGTTLSTTPNPYQEIFERKGLKKIGGVVNILSALSDSIQDKVKHVLNRLVLLSEGEGGAAFNNTIAYKNDKFGNNQRYDFIQSLSIDDILDFTTGLTLSEILWKKSDTFVNNPIIRFFYNTFLDLDYKDSFVNIVTREKIFNPQELKTLNEQINNNLSHHLYPSNYLGERSWEYAIETEGSSQGKITLVLRPVREEGQAPSNKKIKLLELQDKFKTDEQGKTSLNLSIEDINNVLYQMMFEPTESGDLKVRQRDGVSGNAFCTVQKPVSLIKDYLMIKRGPKDNRTPEQMQKDKETAEKLLRVVIEGGGFTVDALLDDDIETIAIGKPAQFMEATDASVAGLSEAARITKTQLESLDGGNRNTNDNNDPNLLLSKSAWKEFKHWLHFERQEGDFPRRRISVTSAKLLIEGINPFKKNKYASVAAPLGDHCDSIGRHMIWQRAEMVDKKIPLSPKDTGDGFYTDEELENTFKNRAENVKTLARQIDLWMEHKSKVEQWYFVTDILRPKGTVTLTDELGNTYNVPMNGELDMVAIDREGNLHIIDFKTTRVKKSNIDTINTLLKGSPVEDALIEVDDGIFEGTREHTLKLNFKYVDEEGNETNTLKGYEIQLNLYKQLLENKGFRVAGMSLLAIPVSYPEPAELDDDGNPILDDQGKLKGEMIFGEDDSDQENNEYYNTQLMVQENGEMVKYINGLSLYDPNNSVNITEIPVSESKYTFDPEKIGSLEGDYSKIFGEKSPIWRQLLATRPDIILKLKNKLSLEGLPGVEVVAQGNGLPKQASAKLEEEHKMPKTPPHKLITPYQALKQGLETGRIPVLVNPNTGERVLLNKNKLKKLIKHLEEIKGNNQDLLNALSVADICNEAKCIGL